MYFISSIEKSSGFSISGPEARNTRFSHSLSLFVEFIMTVMVRSLIANVRYTLISREFPGKEDKPKMHPLVCVIL
jgi:hypothetical protein